MCSLMSLWQTFCIYKCVKSSLNLHNVIWQLYLKKPGEENEAMRLLTHKGRLSFRISPKDSGRQMSSVALASLGLGQVVTKGISWRMDNYFLFLHDKDWTTEAHMLRVRTGLQPSFWAPAFLFNTCPGPTLFITIIPSNTQEDGRESKDSSRPATKGSP